MNEKRVYINEIETEIAVKRHLTLKEFGDFVREMTAVDFVKNDKGVMEYCPYHGRILFPVLVVKYYTNLESLADLEENYAAVLNLNIYDAVISFVGGTPQFKDLAAAVNTAQEHYKAENFGVNGLLISVKNAIASFDINEVMQTLQEFSPEQLAILELKDLAAAFNKVQTPDSNLGTA
jgi:hypothetical protein